ncbi:MAG TPA: glycosyltransferase family 1 protein [Candidatus Saccharimonadia bacterium]
MKQLAIDIDILAHDSKTGVYYYTQRLLAALLARPRAYGVTLAYFGKAQPLSDWELPAGSATVRAVTWLPRKLYRLTLRTVAALPFDLMTGVRADAFLFTKVVALPLVRRVPNAVVIHDTAYVDYPDVMENWHFRKYLEWGVPRGIKRASLVITISESTKSRLMELYGVPEQKIRLIPPAVDHAAYHPYEEPEVARVREKFGITKPYILSVCTLEPRKNLVTLLRACADFPPELLRDYQLVLAGRKGWHNAELDTLLDELGKKISIVVTGYVLNEDLPVLYAGAAVFVLPSLYEGFGMPVLEAMACGAPVITANNSSLPEVAGEAGVLVEALDVAGLCQAMVDVLHDDQRRARMRRAGLARAQAYSWEKSATLLANVIDELMESGSKA